MNRLENLTSSKDLTELLDNLEPINSPAQNGDDLPPEFCTYKDEGCELAEACLECPLPQCVFELPWGQVRVNKAQRDYRIRYIYSQSRISTAKLAKYFGVSQRTVLRALKGRNSIKL